MLVVVLVQAGLVAIATYLTILKYTTLSSSTPNGLNLQQRYPLKIIPSEVFSGGTCWGGLAWPQYATGAFSKSCNLETRRHAQPPHNDSML